jgi:hypothetical protein
MDNIFVFRTTEFNGDWTEIRIEGGALEAACYLAFEGGWTPPKW